MDERKLPAEGTEARDVPPMVSNIVVLYQQSTIVLIKSTYIISIVLIKRHHVTLGRCLVQQAQTSQVGEEERGMSAMQCEIACRALDLLMVLVLPGDGNKEGVSNEKEKGGSFGKSERQSVVAGTEDGLLAEMLAHVGFSRADVFSRSPKVCREKAMRVTGALVDGHPTNQYNMGEVRGVLVG